MAGLSVDLHKVQPIVECVTPTSWTKVLRFTGLVTYYRWLVEGYPEMAVPLTALGSPTAWFTWTVGHRKHWRDLTT